MEKSGFSCTYDYLSNKERLLKTLPLKRWLYNSRKQFQKKPFLYICFKSLIGIIFFFVPATFLILLFNKNYYSDYDTCAILMCLLPGIVSCSLLIVFSFLLLTWRIISSFKVQSFYLYDVCLFALALESSGL